VTDRLGEVKAMSAGTSRYDHLTIDLK
jgi:hypothetical protein